MSATHQLAASSLASLARGYGGPQTIAELRSGQLSKHLLLLRALDATAARVAPEERQSSGFDDAYALLSKVQEAAPETVSRALLHPHVGAWLVQSLQRLHDPGADRKAIVHDLLHLGGVAIAAAAQAGIAFELERRTQDGLLFLPMIGLAMDLTGLVTVVSDGARSRVLSGDDVVEMSSNAAPAWLPVRRLLADEGGLSLMVDLDDLDPYRAHNHPAVAGRLSDVEVRHWQETFTGAWSLLVHDHPEHAQALQIGLRSLVPQESDDPNRSISATSTDAFGAIALSRPSDARQLGVTLIHEFQHGKLGALLDLAPLHAENSSARYCAPWRDDPRPLGGLLQGTYAFLGVTDFWRGQRHRTDSSELAHFEFARWREQTWRATEELASSPDLTELGRTFIAGMGSTLDAWRHETVPGALAAQARDSAADHRARWRARNLRPTEADVEATVDAWHGGFRRPALAPAALVIGTPAAHTDAARLQLWHLRLTQPQRFAALEQDPSAVDAVVSGAVLADVLYVSGDLVGAAAQYWAQIVQGAPISAWIGLALSLGGGGESVAATALLAEPELLLPVYERLSARTPGPDPVELACWLAADASSERSRP